MAFFSFLTGVLFAYFVILPNVLDFFYNYSLEMGIQNDWRIGYYISFATQFVLIFGLAFELPVVVMTLVKLGILSYEMMRTTRSYAVLAIFVIAAIITPTPDALTLCLLAVPMYILYEICIWLSYFLEKKERALEEEEESARRARLLAAPGAASRANDEDEDDEHDDIDHDDFDHESDEHDFDDHDTAIDPEAPQDEDEDAYRAEHEFLRDHEELDYEPDPEEEDLHSQAPLEPEDSDDEPPEFDNRDEDPNFDPLK